MAAKKVTAAKNTLTAKKSASAKKNSASKGVKTGKKPPVDEAIHYYLGPDGEIVKEVLEYYEPKRLSKLGEWKRAHPKGILKILDMKAVMK